MKQINGYWWPDSDKQCHPVVPKQVKDLEKALQLTNKFDLCIQAGGNVGIWANRLKDNFYHVWTIEPDLENYICLLHNMEEGIFPLFGALGDEPKSMGLKRDPKNVGAHQMYGEGRIPVFTIDELHVPACDLIVLDIEGMEHIALEGAKKTIETFKPTIMVEDKGLSELYGAPQGWSESFPGYVVADRIHRDVILVPE